jgi:hypothetical protein
MLLSRDSSGRDLASELDSVHHYYEGLVIGETRRLLVGKLNITDYIADIVCVALNHLPPRYIRHDVDMAFYLSPKERGEIEEKINNAVVDAIAFVDASSTQYNGARGNTVSLVGWLRGQQNGCRR